MMYPAMVFIFAVIVLIAMLLFLIPIFVKIFAQLNGKSAVLSPSLRRRRVERRAPLPVGDLPAPPSLLPFIFKWWKATGVRASEVGPLLCSASR